MTLVSRFIACVAALGLVVSCSATPTEIADVPATTATASEPVAEPQPTTEPEPPAENEPTAEAEPTATATPVEGSTAAASMAELMALVPLSAFDAPVRYGNYASAIALTGLEPGPCTSDAGTWFDALIETDRQLSLSPGLPASWSRLNRDGETFEMSFGFRLCDVGSYLDWMASPGGAVLYSGDVDRAAIDAAVMADPVWSARVEQVRVGEESLWSWGEGLDFEARNPARSLGESGTLGVIAESIAVRTPNVALHTQIIDAASAGSSALADDPVLAATVVALADTDPFVAEFVEGSVVWNRTGLPTSIDQLDSAPTAPLMPYRWLGYGATFDGAEKTTVVLGHDDAETAQLNATRFADFVADGAPQTGGAGEALWSDLFVVESAEAVGTVTVIELRPNRARSAYLVVQRAVLGADNLFWAAPEPG